MARKSNQRERLFLGMVRVANRVGYAGATVSAVTEEARISRPTFYEQFDDRDDCFAETIKWGQAQLLELIDAAIATARPEQALQGAAEALVSFAAEHPELGRFLMAEAMGGGRQALDARDQGIAKIAAAIEDADGRIGERAVAPDLESRVVIGGIYRLLATHLRRGERWISRLNDDLPAWLESYSAPVAEHRWRSLQAAPVAPLSPFVPAEPLHMPPGFPPGRPTLPEEQVAETHRLRIIVAAALLAERKGYTATTVQDIVKLSKVAYAVFYRLFSDKQDAFMAAHGVGFGQVMDVTAAAFFSAEEWPERSWQAGQALTQLLERNPLVAHVGFVEAYAVGPGAVQRIDDSHVAFTIFLREGFRYRPQENPPSGLALEAIIATIFELLYHQARSAGTLEIAQFLPHIAHVWLTPFLGGDGADTFIDAKLTALESDGKGKHHRES